MKRFEVWLVNLDPTVGSEIKTVGHEIKTVGSEIKTVGSEIKKTRPAVIVSPDELNANLQTVVVVPLTTGRAYPFRIATKVRGKPGVAAIDQIRTVDKRRLVKKISTLHAGTAKRIMDGLVEMFFEEKKG